MDSSTHENRNSYLKDQNNLAIFKMACRRNEMWIQICNTDSVIAEQLNWIGCECVVNGWVWVYQCTFGNVLAFIRNAHATISLCIAFNVANAQTFAFFHHFLSFSIIFFALLVVDSIAAIHYNKIIYNKFRTLAYPIWWKPEQSIILIWC